MSWCARGDGQAMLELDIFLLVAIVPVVLIRLLAIRYVVPSLTTRRRRRLGGILRRRVGEGREPPSDCGTVTKCGQQSASVESSNRPGSEVQASGYHQASSGFNPQPRTLGSWDKHRKQTYIPLQTQHEARPPPPPSGLPPPCPCQSCTEPSSPSEPPSRGPALACGFSPSTLPTSGCEW